MVDQTFEAAAAYTTTNFAIIDGAKDQPYPDNIRSLDFNVMELGYLAGTLAADMAISGTIGAIGGMPLPVVVNFITGYENGARTHDPSVTVVVTYTNNFWDPAVGEVAAQQLIDAGAEVIFNVSGPSGSGGILYAAQQGVWVIGVDRDEWDSTFEGGAAAGHEKLLTSAIKHFNLATCDTISDQDAGAFTSGIVEYDLGMLDVACDGSGRALVGPGEGLGLAPFHEASMSIPADTKANLDRVRQGLINGTIDERMGYRVFLPLVVR